MGSDTGGGGGADRDGNSGGDTGGDGSGNMCGDTGGGDRRDELVTAESGSDCLGLFRTV